MGSGTCDLHSFITQLVPLLCKQLVEKVGVTKTQVYETAVLGDCNGEGGHITQHTTRTVLSDGNVEGGHITQQNFP